MQNIALAALLSFACAPAGLANDIRVDAVAHERIEERVRVTFDIAWSNAWRNARNHDAAWVFVKTRAAGRGWRHARLTEARESTSAAVDAVAIGPRAALNIASDRIGTFVACAGEHRGDVAWRLTLELEPTDVPTGEFEVAVFALEMVHVPDGSYWLGDVHPDAVANAAWFTADTDGEPLARHHVTSEAAIEVGPGPGRIDHRVTTRNEYQGDRSGPIPLAFPKGTRAFYCMKYELAQGEYAQFLEHLSEGAAAFRANFAVRGYERQGGSIALAGERYVASAPRRPLSFIGWDDGCAFLDWAGLRPMSEFEFVKAARGPDEPVARDYPWGTATKERLVRVRRDDWDLETSAAADESLLSDATRDVIGASHWWVMDLAGSVWERVVSAGHPRGRAFEGSHGDGRLSDYGSATNADWPRGDDLDAGGVGYLGGGWYGPDHPYREGDFNPHSPVAWRPFAAWGQSPRYVAYGMRGVRTDVRHATSPSDDEP